MLLQLSGIYSKSFTPNTDGHNKMFRSQLNCNPVSLENIV